LPALVAVCERSRKLVLSDVFAFATAGWIVMAASQADGSDSMSSAVSEALEFFGGYLVARAFIFGPAALREFVKVLKILAFVTLLFAITESMSGRLIVHEIVASIFGTTPPDAQYRNGFVRATATLDHAILFGAFCCFTGTILLYAESDAVKRTVYVSLCLLGCLLSLSSSALISSSIVIAAYSYDRAVQRYPWRWVVFWAIAALPVFALFAVSGNPLGWILTHLTLDPESGYFRLMIWNEAFERLPESPLIGFGFNPLNSDILDATVDSVWLVFALRFGIPMIALLLLSTLTACLPQNRDVRIRGRDVFMGRLSTAFTMVLFMYIFIGLTVHFWNYIWMFWGLCIGVRASLREWSFKEAAQHAAQRRVALSLARAAFDG
jgi:MFS family permease